MQMDLHTLSVMNREQIKQYNKQYSKQYYEKNKEWKKQYNKQYREKNKEQIKEYSKQYCETHKEQKRKCDKRYRKQYYERNKNQIMKQTNLYIQKRIKEDPVFKLRATVSTVVRQALKKQNATKNNSILKYLPYTMRQLKEHIESQFEPWMSWKNHGNYKLRGKRVWHIDHIIPQSVLPYDSMEHPNFQKAWALENLRPLEAVENIKKSNKIR